MQMRKEIWIAFTLSSIWITPAEPASETVLLRFSSADGANPQGVVHDSAGNLYGATAYGGALGWGVVYKLDTTGETVLYNFSGGLDGGGPSSVIRDSAGNLYGAAVAGGGRNLGAVFKVDTAGHETVLHSFGFTDGACPIAGVTRDSEGNLYGTTNSGGLSNCGLQSSCPSGCGVVYKLDATDHERVLYEFTGGLDGGNPYTGVIRDSAGNLYGTTGYGGASNAGVVYKIDTTGHETVLYNFTQYRISANAVIRDAAGNLYGSTQAGGNMNCLTGCGMVYRIDTAGHETVLYSFTGGADGGNPSGPLIGDSAGNLYGTAVSGGTAGYGVVYKVDSAGHETVLYNFTGGMNGYGATAGVIPDSAGNLYGTTYNGGIGPGFGNGVVFKLAP